MKKIFTLMLTFACAMFVGVSCTTDPNDGANGGGSKEAFTAVWDTENATPSEIAVTVTAANKKELFFCFGSNELSDFRGNPYPGETPLEQIDYMLVEAGVLNEIDPTNPADGYIVFKGTSDVVEGDYTIKKTLYRNGPDHSVQLYVVGVKFSVSAETGETTYEYTTDLYTYEPAFLGYPDLVVAEESVSLSYEAGTYELSCELKNPMADQSVKFRGLPSWVEANWADNVVTLTYKVNPSKMERSATFEIAYGYYDWVNITVTQAGDPNVTVPTLSVELAENGNYFNKFVVNTTSSDPNASYIVGAVNSEEKTLTLADLTKTIVNNFESADSFEHYTGNQSNVTLKLNCNHFEWSGLDHYVYICPVDHVNKVVLAEPTYIEVKVDDSKKPVLAWADEVANAFVYNEIYRRYEYYVQPNSKNVTLNYTVTNLAEEGEIKIAAFNNYNEVMDGSKENMTIIQPDAGSGTGSISFDVTDWKANKTNHHFYFTLAYRHATDSNWDWSVNQLTVYIVHIDPNVSAEPLAN